MKRGMAPVHPGAILWEDVLKEKGLSITQAAEELQISRKQLSEIVNEQASITALMAVKLHRSFGIDSRFWLDLVFGARCG